MHFPEAGVGASVRLKEFAHFLGIKDHLRSGRRGLCVCVCERERERERESDLWGVLFFCIFP